MAVLGLYPWFTSTFGNNAQRTLRAGEEAIERSDRLEAERIISLLETKGEVDAARLIRGRMHLVEARLVEEQIRQERNLTQAGRGALAAAWGGEQAVGGGMLGPLAPAGSLWGSQLAALDLRPAERRQLMDRYDAHVQHASHQLTSIPPDSPCFAKAMLPAAEAAVRLRDAGGVIPLEPVFRLLARAADNNPDDLTAQRWLAIVCLDLNLKEEAIAALRAVGRLDSTDGRPHRSLGLLLSSHAHVGEAMEAYREALNRKLEPHVQAEVVIELARLEVKHGLPARALETLARCPATFADDPDCLTIRAAALGQIGTENGRREAQTLLERVLETQPRHAEALVTLAHLHLDEERTREAIALLERSLQASPGDEDVHSRLALSYRQLGDAAKAEHHTRRADEVREGKKTLVTLVQEARRETANADVRVRAAEICIQLQRWREARVWLRAALACDPTHAGARQLLRRVENEQRAAH